MKKLSLFLFMLGISLSMNAQNKEIRKLYRSAKRSENTQKMKLPGIVLDLGMLVAKKEITEEPGGRELYQSIKKINKFRLVNTEDQRFIKNERTTLLRKRLNNKMEQLIAVNAPQNNFSLLIKEKKNRIKKIVILGHMEDSFILFAANSNINLDALNSVIQSYSGEIEEFDLLD